MSSPDEDTNADLTEEDLKQIAKEQMDSTQVANLYGQCNFCSLIFESHLTACIMNSNGTITDPRQTRSTHHKP